jgi:hypothetical protein
MNIIRNDCAFCGYERSLKDDNHGPDCSYWDFFGACICGFPFDRSSHGKECKPEEVNPI